MTFGTTWTCHICKQERPDRLIGVLSKDTSEEYGMPFGTMKQNVRYCIDNIDCVHSATDYRHTKSRDANKN